MTSTAARADRMAWLTATMMSLGVPIVLVSALSAVMLGLLLAGAPAALAVGLGQVVMLICALHAGLVMAQSHNPAAVFGKTALARFAVSVMAIALVGPSLGISTPMLTTVFATQALALVIEMLLTRLVPVSFTVVAGLDQVPQHSGPWFRPEICLWANQFSPILLLFGFWGTPLRIVAVIASGLAALIALICLIDTTLGVLTRHRQEALVPRRLRQLKPHFALYWVAEPGSAYQIAMWLPYLERIGFPYVVIVRTRPNFDEARALTTRPVILLRYREDLDAAVVPSLRAVFYTNNMIRNMHMVRFQGLSHIHLNHGDSDKSVSVSPVFRMYDRNFVAGQAAIDRFEKAGVPVHRDTFVIVGRPQVEEITVAQQPISQIARPKMLYAPTWFGTNEDSRYSSLGVGVELVELLLQRDVDIIFRPHPHARRRASYAAAISQIETLLRGDSRPGAAHVWGPRAETDWSIIDCFNQVDAMISDVSSVVNDFLYSTKPFAIVAVTAAPADFAREAPIAQAAYVIDAHSGRLVGAEQQLEQMLTNDPLRPVRLELKAYYLGDFPQADYSQHFLTAARQFVS